MFSWAWQRKWSRSLFVQEKAVITHTYANARLWVEWSLKYNNLVFITALSSSLCLHRHVTPHTWSVHVTKWFICRGSETEKEMITRGQKSAPSLSLDNCTDRFSYCKMISLTCVSILSCTIHLVDRTQLAIKRDFQWLISLVEWGGDIKKRWNKSRYFAFYTDSGVEYHLIFPKILMY